MIPFEATHPGELIKDELDARGLNFNCLRITGVNMDIDTFNQLIAGKTSITESIANDLEIIFGIEAKFWLNMQAQYEADVIEIAEKKLQDSLKVTIKTEKELEFRKGFVSLKLSKWDKNDIDIEIYNEYELYTKNFNLNQDQIAYLIAFLQEK